MKRLALILTVLALVTVSCSSQRNAVGGGCKGTKGYIGYGRK